MKASRDDGELQSVTRRRSPTVYHATFDREQTAPSMAVVEAMADVMATDPMEMDPLQNTVDTDALDAIVGDRSGGRDSSVTLTVADYSVTVSSDGTVTVALVDGDRTEPTEAATSRP